MVRTGGTESLTIPMVRGSTVKDPLGGSTDKDAQAGSTDKAAITFRCSTIRTFRCSTDKDL